ncbi:MAG: alpha/beta hydrolase [Anaerolineae bacterium]|nr:alpha/beta hydrolase [Anaerolineae bacterium]
MSAITIENDLVHYEVLGRGRPVIFVHGWLGSWRYWVPTMQQLSMKYRTYALDLWGFGDSGKDAAKYGFKEQVKLLNDFMEKMGMPKAALVGHSLGAAICLRFASQYPDKAPRVMLVSPPLFDLGGLEDGPIPAPAAPAAPAAPVTPPSTDLSSHSSETIMHNPLRGLGQSREEILANVQAKNQQGKPLPANAPALPTSIGTPILNKSANTPATAVPKQISTPRTDAPNPLITRLTNIKPAALLAKHLERSAPDYDKLDAEVKKTDENVIAKSAQSFTGVNLSVELHRLASPTLLLHGKDDPLLPAPSDELLRQIARNKPAGHFLPLVEPGLRHFPMLEITAKFNRLLMDFLEAPDLTNIQFKDQWVRTMR